MSPSTTGAPVFYWENATKDQIFDHVFGNVIDDAKASGPWEFWQGREGGADVITGDLWSKTGPLAPSSYACLVSNLIYVLS